MRLQVNKAVYFHKNREEFMSKLAQRFMILLDGLAQHFDFWSKWLDRSLSGTVVDAADAVVVGAYCKVSEPSTGREFTATTSDKVRLRYLHCQQVCTSIRVTATGLNRP